jgi:hypothetical protein
MSSGPVEPALLGGWPCCPRMLEPFLRPGPTSFEDGLVGSATGRRCCLPRRSLRGARVGPQASGPAPFLKPQPGYTGTPRGCGGIGRRARFRSVWGQPRGGSSPLIRIAGSRGYPSEAREPRPLCVRSGRVVAAHFGEELSRFVDVPHGLGQPGSPRTRTRRRRPGGSRRCACLRAVRAE